MHIAWNAFTPWSALLGGVMIGCAVALFVLINGRVAGVSGIVGGLLTPRAGDIGWRIAFVLGLLGAPQLYLLAKPNGAPHIASGSGALLLAGVLVGLGTRYGAGCTSGHGICGLSRLSARSAAATAIFIAAGGATVFALHHLA
ncbi:MAG: YeeE/YedE family protein [Pseudomonadota bacterium]